MATTKKKKKSSIASQTKRIKKHLESGKTITPVQALSQYGCFRLSARIYDLRYKHKMNIDMKLVSESGHRYAQYRLIKPLKK